MDKYKILVVDDDKDIVNLLSDILEDEGYEVYKEYNGAAAIRVIENNMLDMCIFDVMMPEMDGFELCKKVRDGINIPILFLTAKSKSRDKIIGFELGADDFITKPFDDDELIARVKAHLRRQKRVIKGIGSSNDGTIEFKGIKINKNSYEVFINEEKVDLSTREFQILNFFMSNSNIVLSREQIYNSVWGYEEYGDINTVTVHIKKLREKVDKTDKFIKTVWGIGYKFIGDKE